VGLAKKLAIWMAKIGEFVTVVDVGTYSVKAALGERVSDGYKILGYSTVKTNGFSSDGIIDAVGLRASIGEALGELQSQMMKKNVFGDLIVTISSDAFSLERQRVEKAFSGEKREVIRESHVRGIFSSLMKEENVVDVIPMKYKLDDGRIVVNPISMATDKLTAEMLLVKIDPQAKEEIMSLLDGYGFSSIFIAHPGILAAEGVLNESEKDRGILCIDMGYSTTKVIAYTNGVPIGFHFVPLGVKNIVKDVAKVFKVSYTEAERLIFYHSNLNYEELDEEEMVETTDFDNKTKKEIKKRSLSLTSYARAREILSISRRSVAKLLNNPTFSPVGVVITGGGASIPGISNIGSSVFNITCRMGTYASSNNVIVSGAEDIISSSVYTPLFGAFVHRYRYGFVEGKTFKNTGSFSKVMAASEAVEDSHDTGNGMFKKLWEFLKKLV
jgi:cell division protein FtsA